MYSSLLKRNRSGRIFDIRPGREPFAGFRRDIFDLVYLVYNRVHQVRFGRIAKSGGKKVVRVLEGRQVKWRARVKRRARL